MKELKGIAFSIPSEEEDYIKLDSLSSLSEADIAIFNPSFENSSYSTYSGSFDDGTYNGKPCYNHDSSAKITEHSSHWINELKSYLNTGKTLFVILSEKKQFYMQTGQKQFSGTGRNRQTTNIVAEFSNFNYLPKIEGIKFNVAHGNKIIANDSLFKNLLERFGNYMTYETYLTVGAEFKCGLITKNKDKVLGGTIKALGGHIVFLPKLNLDINEFTTIDKNDEACWTDEGIIVGKQFVQSIIEIDLALRKTSNKTPRPDWLNNNEYILKKSLEIKQNIEINKSKIATLNDNIQILKEELEESEKLNDLIFETGTPLEDAVIYALKLLGFKAENYDDGVLELDQVIISPEGVRYIGECEGKDNKAIDITKFRQLSDALNEDFEREEVKEKAFGILFGNPHRLTEPSKRIDTFTNKCKSGAERENIGLIETTELYRVAKYLLENKDENFKKKCRETLFKDLGKIIKFPTKKTK